MFSIDLLFYSSFFFDVIVRISKKGGSADDQFGDDIESETILSETWVGRLGQYGWWKW
jgi:hypothetical protein